MLLYHFTTIDFISPDRTPGEVELRALSIGEVPLRDGSAANAVWLTTDPEVQLRANLDGPQGLFRIKLRVPSSDRKLKHWHKWARREYGNDFFERFFADLSVRHNVSADVARRKTRAWWMYWGIIPPEWFVQVEFVKGLPWWEIRGPNRAAA